MKFLNLLFVLAFVFVLSSCGGEAPTNEGGDNQEQVDQGEAGSEETSNEGETKEEETSNEEETKEEETKGEETTEEGGEDHEGHDH